MVMAVICGGIIGFEREYKNKSAGFRTIVLITLGSTIFTIVSRHGQVPMTAYRLTLLQELVLLVQGLYLKIKCL